MGATIFVTVEDLAKKLKNVFCIENRTNKKYSEVWLSDVDFGGLYQNEKVVVNVKAEHKIISCNEEIKYIFTNLFKQLSKEELGLIWRVDVYNSFEEIHCQSDELLVFTPEESCS